MYPILFRIGWLEITSFGAMMAVGVTTALWLFHREATRSALPPTVLDAAFFGVMGGFVGAKLLWTIEHADRAPILELLFSRGGLSWYGGLIGGVGSGLALVVARGWPVVRVLAAATPALALGQLLGRVGCFLVGDDYGWPTDLPWGMAFPEGLPPTDVRVHPTQLYEALGLLLVMMALIHWRRDGVSDATVLGRYLVCVATLRFLVEFLRVHQVFAFGLAPAHWLSLGVAVVGLRLLMERNQARR